jgi:hypothetical protein
VDYGCNIFIITSYAAGYLVRSHANTEHDFDSGTGCWAQPKTRKIYCRSRGGFALQHSARPSVVLVPQWRSLLGECTQNLLELLILGF